MKKSKLLVSLLTSIIAVSSLTACNSGVGQTTSSTSSYAAKSLAQEELAALSEKINNINTDTEINELLAIIQRVSEIQNDGNNPDIDKVHESFTKAIADKKFGNDPDILLRLARSLGQMNITSLKSQLNIVEIIDNKVFFTDVQALRALVTSLGQMNITNVDTQFSIMFSITQDTFGRDKEVLKALIMTLVQMNITDEDSQTCLTLSITKGVFGKDPEVLQALAISLGQMNITSNEAQKEIAEAISTDRFGTDPEVLKALAISLGKMNITDPRDIKSIGDKYLELNPNLAKYILSRWIISDEVIAYAPEFAPYHFFGQLEANVQSRAKEAESDDKIENVENVSQSFDIALGSLNVPKEGNLGSYGFIYNENGEPEALIILAENDSLQEYLTGFLKMTVDTQPIYSSLVNNVKVYKIKTNGGYTYVDNAHDVPDDELPNWLKIAKSYVTFDPNSYQDADLIKFALSFPQKLTDPEMSRLSTSVIQRLIINQGGTARIGSDISTDQGLKDKINTEFLLLLERLLSNDLDAEINSLWNTLPDTSSKAKLIFLLGQIAKQGALGYHHGDNNQANEFYYTLTLKLAEKFMTELDVSDDSVPHASLEELIRTLKRGECIEAASHQFMIDNPHLHLNDVWMKQ